MPKKKNDWLRQYKGDYAAYDFYSQTNIFRFDAIEHLTNNNPELADKFTKALDAYQATVAESVEGYPTLRPSHALTKLLKSGGDSEKASELYDVMLEIKDYYKDFSENLPDDKKNYKEFFDLMYSSVDLTQDDYSYITASFDNPVFMAAPLMMGSAPYLTTKYEDGVEKKADYAALEKVLREPDGRGYFEPYMGLCKAQNSMLRLEKERQKNDRYGWTPESKKAFLDQYKKNLQDFIKNYDELKETVRVNEHLYLKDVHLNNEPDELVGFHSSRDINFVVGHMRGQVKALENGWDYEELPLLGHVAEIVEHQESNIRNERVANTKSQNSINANKERIEGYNKELEQLQRDLILVEKTARGRYQSEAGGPSQVDQMRAQFADIIKWYKDYSKDYKYRKNHGATKEELKKIEEENAEKLQEYSEYRSFLDEFTLESQIRDISKKIAKVTADKEKAEATIRSEEKEIARRNKIIEAGVKRKAELEKTRDKILNKKVTNLEEKRAVLKDINAFIASSKDTETTYTHDEDKNIEIINKKLTTGYDEVVEKNAFAKNQIQYDLDIYGPNPKYHEGWEKSQVISSVDFHENIVPLNDELRRGIPFTDNEIAYINMAATLTAYDAIEKAYVKSPDHALTPEQISVKDYSTWTEDFSSRDTGPRENVTQFKGIIKAGRERGYEAMKQYAAGQKAPLAEMMHTLMYRAHKSFNTAMTISNNAPHLYNQLNTFMRMLERDPELYKEFASYNEKLPESERIDFEKVNQVKAVARLYMESTNDLRKLKEFDANYDKAVQDLKAEYYGEELRNHMTELSNQRSRLELSALRRDVLNHVQTEYHKHMTSSPAFVESNIKVRNVVSNRGDAVKAINDKYVENMQNAKLSAVYTNIGSSEGLNDFDHFVDHMIEKYNMKIENGDFKINGKDVSSSPQYRFECHKYMLECEQKKLLEQISMNDFENEDARNEVIAEYMVNNHQICELERAIEDGFIRDFYKKDDNHVEANYEKSKSYKSKVKDYIKNMDFSSMNSSEMAEQLELGKYSLDAVCDDILTIVDNEIYADPKNVQAKKLTSLEKEVENLSSKKFYKRGSAEFDQLVDELKAILNQHVNYEKDFKDLPHHPYDAKKLAIQEKKLLDKMDVYLDRKKAEKKAGKDSKASNERVEAMTKARRKLQSRFDEELSMPDRTEEKLKAADATAALMGETLETRQDVAEVTGKELLEAAMFEEELQRKDFINQLTNSEKGVGDAKVERLHKSVKNSLYYQLLNDALGPKEGDSPIQAKMKDDMTKGKLLSGIDPKMDEQLDLIMKTNFGNRLFANVISEAAKPGADLNQENMMKLRDQTLRECYKDAMKPDNPNKKFAVKQILEIGESLGSPELKQEYAKYLKAQEAAKKKAKANADKKEIDEELQRPRSKSVVNKGPKL